MDKDANPF